MNTESTVIAARRLYSASDPIRDKVNHARIMRGDWDTGTWLPAYIAKVEAARAMPEAAA